MNSTISSTVNMNTSRQLYIFLCCLLCVYYIRLFQCPMGEVIQSYAQYYIGLYIISMNKINTHLDIIVLAILTYTVDIERLLLLYVCERSVIQGGGWTKGSLPCIELTTYLAVQSFSLFFHVISAMRVMPVNRRQIYYAVLISTRPAHAHHDKDARL